MADRYSPTPYETNIMKQDMIDRSPQHENGLRGRSHSRSRSRSPRRIAKPVQSKRLYISNMPFDLKWKDVKDLFKQHVGDCYVTLYDRADGKPMGAGLIEFRDVNKAQEAADKMNRFEVGGRKIIVREETERDRRRHANDLKSDNRGPIGRGDRGMDHPMDRRGPPPMGGLPMNLPPGVTPQLLTSLGIHEGPITNQVFVANLDYRCTEQKLKEVFSMAGSVTKLECKNDKDGKFRGMAVVAFETPLEALQAISMFHGQTLFDRNMSVKMDKLASVEEKKPSLPEGLKGIGSSLPLGGGPMSGPGGFMGSLGSGMGPLGGMSSTMGSLSGSMMMGGSGGSSSMGGMSSSGDFGSGLGSLGGFGSGLGSGGSSSIGGLGSSGSSYGMDNLGGGSQNLDVNLKGLGDLSGFASLAANLQNNPEAFNTLSNMMNNIGGGGGRGYGGRDSGMDRGMERSSLDRMRRSPLRGMSDTGEITSVFVRNLPFSYTWQMMKETFKAAGEVQYAEIKKDEDNKSRGFGVVRFTSPDEARRAVNLFNKTRVNGRELEVRLNMAPR
ncbi:myelin expression factor 2-like [Watersipora subatra]|uniref:myelin expression factor 2-like n=1 Tax=Watersipora subatra TaxID=2589382 RepID=UPI00355C80DB